MFDPSYDFSINRASRQNIESILDSFDEKSINLIPKPFSNNLIWNYCHVVVTQAILTYGLSGLWIPIEADQIKAFRKGSHPDQKITWDQYQEWKELSNKVLQQTEDDYHNGKFEEFKEYTTSYNMTLSSIEDAIRFNNAHEGMHLGTCLAIRKFL